MKNFIKAHSRIFIALALFLVSYLVMCIICSTYIEFYPRQTNRWGDLRYYSHEETKMHIKIALFYFRQLPLCAMIPSAAYLLLSYIDKKNQNN